MDDKQITAAEASDDFPHWRLLWRVILIIHAVFAIAWWWIMPGGFPAWNIRFWANCAVPWAVVVAAVAGLICFWTRRTALLQPLLIAVPVAWTSALISAVLIFPISSRRCVLPMLGAAVFLWAAYFIAYRLRWSPKWLTVLAVLIAAIAGVAVPWMQRAPVASTQPMDEPLPEFQADRDLQRPPGFIPISENLRIQTSDGEVRAKYGDLSIDVLPLLTFDSRSPDRCWTILAPLQYRMGHTRQLSALGTEESGAWLKYEGDATRVLHVWQAGDGSDRIESFTKLSEPVYSHLNSYCELSIGGHRKLALAFSPCPDARIEPLPSDYPTGRPARLAYFDGEQFRVVEARSAEKGPFRTLAAGPCRRGDPLAITLYNDSVPVCQIVLEDWTRQVDTTLSPTAGWRVPAGAIEFSRVGDEPGDPVVIWVSLAATSVGRGWDSVGHAAGTYRNRVRIEPVSE